MPDLALHVRKELTSIGLVPSPVQLLGRNAELDNKIARQILGLDFPASLAMMIRASEPPMKYRLSAGLILTWHGLVVDCLACASGFGA
jgi:hypothetical protein